MPSRSSNAVAKAALGVVTVALLGAGLALHGGEMTVETPDGPPEGGHLEPSGEPRPPEEPGTTAPPAPAQSRTSPRPPRPADCSEPIEPALEPAEITAPVALDELHEQVLDHLDMFVRWLNDGDAKGAITEVGWPDGPWAEEWNALADNWYRAIAGEDLWVTNWAAGEWWEPSHDLSVYRSNDGSALDTTTGISPVIERHRAVSVRGVNLNGGEFGVGANIGTGTGGGFSNRAPGIYGETWRYPGAETFHFLACREVAVVRLPLRWERLQPDLRSELDPVELSRLQGTVSAAGQVGIQVIPVIMNYGAYWRHDPFSGRGEREPIGSTAVSVADYADLWRRLADALGDHGNILAWDIMNEPTDMPGDARGWETASQAAVDAIRSTGDTRTVVVPGYSWATVTKFAFLHPDGPWIRDPADEVRYAGHHYFDDRLTGRYFGYDVELGAVRHRSGS
jgi:hypothetical protein